ncbi:MAG: hypothetical protein JKY25_01100 [Robiginitomaculum sp.]|nr:hypothetical protein [Robiginitomaculum sp.]
MKLATSFTAIFIIGGLAGLGACTTVDLSQVAIEQPKVIEKPDHNVVERSSVSLTNLFRQKGWSKSGPKEMTNMATRVLLGGLEKNEDDAEARVAVPVSPAQLDADILEANTQILQTTKAAEVYLTIADDAADLGTELSLLEKALLSARDAENKFAQSIGVKPNVKTEQDFALLSGSVDRLKDVTDAYGDRIRAQITARASASRS